MGASSGKERSTTAAVAPPRRKPPRAPREAVSPAHTLKSASVTVGSSSGVENGYATRSASVSDNLPAAAGVVAPVKTAAPTPLNEEDIAASAFELFDQLAFITNVELLTNEEVSPTYAMYQPRPTSRRPTTTSDGDFMAGYPMPKASRRASPKVGQAVPRPRNGSLQTGDIAEFLTLGSAPDRETPAMYAMGSTRTMEDRRLREEAAPAAQSPAVDSESAQARRFSVETGQINRVEALKRLFSQGGELRRASNDDSMYVLAPARGDAYRSRSSAATTPRAAQNTSQEPFMTSTSPTNRPATTSPHQADPMAALHRRDSNAFGTSHFALNLIPAEGADDVFFFDVADDEDATWNLGASDDDEGEGNSREPHVNDGAQSHSPDGGRASRNSYAQASALFGRRSTVTMGANGKRRARHTEEPSSQLFTTAPSLYDNGDSASDTSSSLSDGDSHDSTQTPRTRAATAATMQRTSLYSLGPMRASVRLADGKLHNVLLLPARTPRAGAPRSPGASPHENTLETDSLGLKPHKPNSSPSQPQNTSFFTTDNVSAPPTVTTGRLPTFGGASSGANAHSRDEPSSSSSNDDDGENPDFSSFQDTGRAGRVSHLAQPESPTYGASATTSPTARPHAATAHPPHRTGQRRVTPRVAAQSVPTRRYTTPAQLGYGQPTHVALAPMRNALMSPNSLMPPPLQQQQQPREPLRRLSDGIMARQQSTDEPGEEHTEPVATEEGSPLLPRPTIERMRQDAAREVSYFSLDHVRYVASPNWQALEPADDDDDDIDEEDMSEAPTPQRANAAHGPHGHGNDDLAASTAALEALEEMCAADSPTPVERPMQPTIGYATRSVPPRLDQLPANAFVPMPRVRH